MSECTGDNLAGEKQSEKPHPSENPKSIRFHCGYCDKDGHQDEYCYRRKRDERNQKKLANKDRYRPSRGVPEPRVEPLPRGVGSVCTVPLVVESSLVVVLSLVVESMLVVVVHFRGIVVGALALGVVSLLVVLLLMVDMRVGGTIVALDLRGATGHVSPSW